MPSQPHPVRHPSRQTPIRVLVAEDNVGIQQFYRDLLEPIGYHVLVVENGRQAVSFVRDGDVDIVLMDVQMPEMDGLEATQAIRQLTPPKSRIPVIAITSLMRSREACVTAGADDYLSKPVDKALLLSALELWTRRAAQTFLKQDFAMPADTDSFKEGGPADPVMDLEVSLARMGQDRTLLLQLAEFFLEDAPKLLSDLDAGVQAHDAAAVNRAAHSLKGLAGNFEALPAVAAGKLVEDECRRTNSTPQDWHVAVLGLKAEIQRLTTALADEVDKPRSAG